MRCWGVSWAFLSLFIFLLSNCLFINSAIPIHFEVSYGEYLTHNRLQLAYTLKDLPTSPLRRHSFDA